MREVPLIQKAITQMEKTFTPLSDSELRNAIEVSGMNNPFCTAATLLSDSELAALSTLAAKKVEPFTLRQLYGDFWYTIRGPRKFGRRVRASKAAGHLPVLRETGKKSKSYLYEWDADPSEASAVARPGLLRQARTPAPSS